MALTCIKPRPTPPFQMKAGIVFSLTFLKYVFQKLLLLRYGKAYVSEEDTIEIRICYSQLPRGDIILFSSGFYPELYWITCLDMVAQLSWLIAPTVIPQQAGLQRNHGDRYGGRTNEGESVDQTHYCSFHEKELVRKGKQVWDWEANFDSGVVGHLRVAWYPVFG